MPYEDLPPNAKRVSSFIIDTLSEYNNRNKALGVNFPSLDDVLDWFLSLPGELLNSPDINDIVNPIVRYLQDEKSSEAIRKFFDGIFNTPEAEETAEILGSVIMGPFLSLMTRYAGDPELDPENFAAAFHGLNILITMPKFIANLLQGSAVGTVLGRIGSGFDSIYWNLGLGFLGWQTLAPFLSAGLQPRLERHYNAKFLPKRFPIDVEMYRYLVHDQTAAELLQKGKELGWRPIDTQFLLNHNFRGLTHSEIKLLSDAGKISTQDMTNELLKAGYNPKYIPTVLKDILQNDSNRDKSPTYSSARKAFKLGVRSQTDFERMLKSLGYGVDAIALEVQLVRLEQRDTQRELSVNQIQDAFVNNVITSVEVGKFLHDLDYGLEETIILANTWAAKKKPKILKVNQGTIKQALMLGVLTSSQALKKLQEIGYEAESSQLIVDTALAAMKIARVRISIDKLITALSLEIISQSEFEAQLRARQVSNDDIVIYTKLAQRQEVSSLGIEDIRQGYIWGAIDEQTVTDLLKQAGNDDNSIRIRLDTWKAQRASFRQRPTAGMLVTFYRQKLLSAQQLETRLKEQGFDASEAELLRKSADLAFPRALSSAEIKETYITQVITKDRALSLLLKTGIVQQESLDLIAAWDKLINFTTPSPSINHLLAAVHDEVITLEEFAEKLKEKGYPESTIEFYIRLAAGKSFEVTKRLTKSDILGLFKDTIITYENALERLIADGYAPEDAELLLSRKKPSIEDSQVHALFMAGYINPDDYLSILTSLGYTLEEITAYLDSLGV